jgi:hypothetical protein
MPQGFDELTTEEQNVFSGTDVTTMSGLSFSLVQPFTPNGTPIDSVGRIFFLLNPDSTVSISHENSKSNIIQLAPSED